MSRWRCADRVRAAVLVGASPGIADAGRARARAGAADERLADEIEALEHRGVRARAGRRTPVLAGQPPEVAARARADRLRNTPGGLGAGAARARDRRAARRCGSGSGSCAMPVVLVVGERDEKFRAIAERMAGAIPDARSWSSRAPDTRSTSRHPSAVAAILGARTQKPSLASTRSSAVPRQQAVAEPGAGRQRDPARRGRERVGAAGEHRQRREPAEAGRARPPPRRGGRRRSPAGRRASTRGRPRSRRRGPWRRGEHAVIPPQRAIFRQTASQTRRVQRPGQPARSRRARAGRRSARTAAAISSRPPPAPRTARSRRARAPGATRRPRRPTRRRWRRAGSPSRARRPLGPPRAAPRRRRSRP